ncbi:MAG: cytochrome c [Chitinophagaceae bacterium]|nr:cytochrome c [Chitinophagaceae bacterium]
MKKLGIMVLACCIIVAASITQTTATKVQQTGVGNAERGKKIYAKECLSCHQADGGGVPRLNPPLSESSWVVGDKKKIIQIVLNGMADRIPIDGEYYSNTMASHSKLTDQQIADVLTYVRTNFGNKASAVTAAEVKAVRTPKKKK